MALRLEQKYGLGEFLLEPGKRLLSRGDAPVPLSKLPFQILLYLIEHRDRVVTRRELLQEFWGGQDVYEDPLRKKVYEDTLRKNVGAVRKALGDGNGEHPRYVETCRGEGYRYVGPFRELPSPEEGSAAARAAEAASVEAAEPQPAGRPDAQPSQGGAKPSRASASPPLPTVSRRGITKRALTGLLLAVAVAVTAFAAYRRMSSRADAGGAVRRAAPRSVAVLPLRNLTEDPANDYLCDGVTESLINALSRVGGLKVVARGSAFSLKGREFDPRELGRRLGVASVLQGGLSRSGGRVRVEVRVVSTEDGGVLWSGAPYDREIGDILVLQEEIARRVAGALEYELSAEEGRLLAARHTRSAEAYEAYLKGRFHLNKRSREGIERAIVYFRQAVELDPNYALAYAALAESYDKSYWYAEAHPREALAKGREAAERALALDDSLAEAHVAMATVYANEWKLPEAAREEERALELDPDNAEARHNYAYRLIDLGRPDEAVAQIKLARDLDPLNVVMNVDVGEILLFARRHDEAIEAFRHALEMDPQRANAHERLGWAYVSKGAGADAVAAFLNSFALAGESAETVASMREAFSSGGIRSFWRKRIELELGRGYPEPATIAIFYVQLGDKDQAFAWLEKAYRERSPSMVGLKSSAYLDPLRPDPRYADLLRRVGLP